MSSRTLSNYRYMHLKTFFSALIYTDRPGTDVSRDPYGHVTYILSTTRGVPNRISSLKTILMANNYGQMEVLLMIGTSFLAGNWVRKDANVVERSYTEIEQLQDACWNGLVKTMLPEVWVEPPNGGILYLWKVREAKSFLELEISEVPLPIDRRLSLKPCHFLSFQVYN